MAKTIHLRNLAIPVMLILAVAPWVAAAASASTPNAGHSDWAHAATAQQTGHMSSTTAMDPKGSDPAGVIIKSSTISGLGPVLVNANGHVLYMFEPDMHKKVTCKATCAVIWPPVVVKGGEKPAAEGNVQQSKLGTVPNPDGSGRVVTYDGWPLYTYVADTGAGLARGQALNLNGGLWYVMSPAGKVIKKKP